MHWVNDSRAIRQYGFVTGIPFLPLMSMPTTRNCVFASVHRAHSVQSAIKLARSALVTSPHLRIIGASRCHSVIAIGLPCSSSGGVSKSAATGAGWGSLSFRCRRGRGRVPCSTCRAVGCCRRPEFPFPAMAFTQNWSKICAAMRGFPAGRRYDPQPTPDALCSQ